VVEPVVFGGATCFNVAKDSFRRENALSSEGEEAEDGEEKEERKGGESKIS